MTDCLIREGNLDTNTLREDHVKTQGGEKMVIYRPKSDASEGTNPAHSDTLILDF